jgi:RNA polymerase sigma-70 factor (ECF subfamily)
MPPENEAENGKPALSGRQRADVIHLVDAGFRYGFSLTHHRQDAEDLVQQACLQVVRKKGRVVEKGYLFVAIRNLFRDGCRRRALVTYAALTDETNNGQDCTDTRHTDNRLDVETILEALPCDDREILYLNCIEGFTAEEIGEVTGHSRSTILSRLARAKRKLTDRFRGDKREGKAVP